MAKDALTVKVEFDKDMAMECVEQVIVERYGMTLDELSQLVNAKQEGRLVVFPCKIGQTVYCVVPCFTCSELDIKDMPKLKKYDIACFGFEKSMVEYFGKTVFLTCEEAENKLKEMQNNV